MKQTISRVWKNNLVLVVGKLNECSQVLNLGLPNGQLGYGLHFHLILTRLHMWRVQ